MIVGLYVGLGLYFLRFENVQGNTLNCPPRCAGEAAPALQNPLIVAVLGKDGGDFEQPPAFGAGQVLGIWGGGGVHWGMTSKSLNSVIGTKANSAEHSGQV